MLPAWGSSWEFAGAFPELEVLRRESKTIMTLLLHASHDQQSNSHIRPLLRKVAAAAAGIATLAAVVVIAPAAGAVEPDPAPAAAQAAATTYHDVQVSPMGSVQFVGSVSGKEVNGAAAKYAKKYKYVLKQTNNTEDKTVGIGGNGVWTDFNDKDGNVIFTDLWGGYNSIYFQYGYLHGAAYKDFTYSVTQSLAYSSAPEGVTMDPQDVKTFTLRLKDDGDGSMSVWYGNQQLDKWKIENNKWVGVAPNVNLFTFTNTVKEVSLTPQGKVTLKGRALTDQDKFKFEITKFNDDTVLATGTSNADGSITFDQPLTFTADSTPSALFEMKEITDDLPYGVTIKSADAAKVFIVSLRYSSDDVPVSADQMTVPEFNNTFDPLIHDEKAPILGSVKFVGSETKKEVDGAAAQYAGKYLYRIEQLNADGTVKNQDNTLNAAYVQGENQADGTVKFDTPFDGLETFKFMQRDLKDADGNYQNSKDFTYRVTQIAKKNGEPEGVTAGETQTFTLTLKYDGKDTMSIWLGDKQLPSSHTGKGVTPTVPVFSFTNTVKQASTEPENPSQPVKPGQSGKPSASTNANKKQTAKKTMPSTGASVFAVAAVAAVLMIGAAGATVLRRREQ